MAGVDGFFASEFTRGRFAERTLNWDDHLQYVALTDVGMRRATNQDSHIVVLASDESSWEHRGHLFLVADGMGAHAAGELASRLAADRIPHLYHKYNHLSPPEALLQAVQEANAEVYERGQSNSDFHNMGTTVSVLILLPQGALIAHIGDSRVYRLRGQELEQLTKDHSLVWELREQLRDDSELAIPKNVITRSLGPSASVQVDVEGPLPMEPGDTYLLCSDGLTGRIEDHELAVILRNLPPEKAGQLLVDLANLRGGPDNITLVIARVNGSVPNQQEARPLKIGSRRQPSVKPILWVFIGVCLLGAIVLGITDHPVLALVSTLAAALAMMSHFIASYRAHRSGTVLHDGRRLGKGPYTRTRCPSTKQATTLLRETLEELRAMDLGERTTLDRAAFDGLVGKGQALEQQGDLPPALEAYAEAVRYFLREVRDRKQQEEEDSIIDF